MLRMPQCFECVHFVVEGEAITCEAYPEGIPSRVLYDSGFGDWDGKCSETHEFTEEK